MSGILVVERIVLESLDKKAKNLKSLEGDTKLDSNLLKNIVAHLMMKGMISRSDYKEYSINLKNKKEWINEVKSEDSISHEVKELFSSLVNNYFRAETKRASNLAMKKVWLTVREREVLDQKFKEIENFLGEVAHERRRNPAKEVTADKQVLFWGHSSYIDLVDEQLEAV